MSGEFCRILLVPKVTTVGECFSVAIHIWAHIWTAAAIASMDIISMLVGPGFADIVGTIG